MLNKIVIIICFVTLGIHCFFFAKGNIVVHNHVDQRQDQSQWQSQGTIIMNYMESSGKVEWKSYELDGKDLLNFLNKHSLVESYFAKIREYRFDGKFNVLIPEITFTKIK